jgi:hypothetical protein
MKVRRFQIDVDSISTPAANEKKRYLLLPGNKNIPHDDLQYFEFTRYIEKAMGEKGFARVGTPEESEVIVFFTYGIGNAEKYLSSYTIPHFGQTGVSASQTTGTKNLTLSALLRMRFLTREPSTARINIFASRTSVLLRAVII